MTELIYHRYINCLTLLVDKLKCFEFTRPKATIVEETLYYYSLMIRIRMGIRWSPYSSVTERDCKIFFFIHSVRYSKNIHMFILTNVCAGMRQHTTTLTISQGLRDPSAPQAIKKVHHVSLYSSFSGLYLLF